jgi:CheY-like chemotaxis protein
MSSAGERLAGRILLVEDDPVAARFTSHVLGKRGGFEITHVTGPLAALDRARDGPWDLVLTDIEMPGMTGAELITELRAIIPHVPVAIMSAHPSADGAVRALRGRADEFLEKPVKPDRLIEVATALVARGRARRNGREGRAASPLDQDG